MAFGFRPSWPTDVRPNSPSGVCMPVLPPLVRPSWPPLPHVSSGACVAFICISSPRQRSGSRAPCLRHCNQAHRRRLAPSPPHHCRLQLAMSSAIFLLIGSMCSLDLTSYGEGGFCHFSLAEVHCLPDRRHSELTVTLCLHPFPFLLHDSTSLGCPLS